MIPCALQGDLHLSPLADRPNTELITGRSHENNIWRLARAFFTCPRPAVPAP